MEVNSTFYRSIAQSTLESWARKVKGREFKFTLKAPGSITHEKMLLSTNEAASQMYQFQKTHLDVMGRHGLIGALLIQLPPYFGENDSRRLLQVMSAVDTGKYPVFVEPRNRELYGNSQFNSEVMEAGGHVVSVDSPEMHLDRNPPDKGGKAYIRMHGRNNSAWFRKGAGKNEKYDYEYSIQELQEVRDIIKGMAHEGDEIFIYFNNHPSGKAPRNAMAMMDILGVKRNSGKQSKLV